MTRHTENGIEHVDYPRGDYASGKRGQSRRAQRHFVMSRKRAMLEGC